MSVDLFDDPPWTSSPAADRHQGRWSAIATLAVCLLGAVGVAISTTLPWFGLDESLGVGFLHLQDQMSALSRYLQPAQFGSLSPGTQEWEFLILALSCGVAMSAIITLGTHVVGRRTPFGLYVVVAVLALLLVRDRPRGTRQAPVRRWATASIQLGCCGRSGGSNDISDWSLLSCRP